LLANGNYRLDVGDLKLEDCELWENTKQQLCRNRTGRIATDLVKLCPLVFKDLAHTEQNLSAQPKKRLIRLYLSLTKTVSLTGSNNQQPSRRASAAQRRPIARQDKPHIIETFPKARHSDKDAIASSAEVVNQIGSQLDYTGSPTCHSSFPTLPANRVEIHIDFLKPDFWIPVYAYAIEDISQSVEIQNLGSKQTTRFCIVARAEHALNEVNVDLSDVVLNPEFDQVWDNTSRNHFWDALYRSTKALRERESILTDPEAIVSVSQGISTYRKESHRGRLTFRHL
jgi:hypothetical protein